MTQATESKGVASRSSELLDEVRESASVGQHAAAEAIRAFRHAIDESLPEAVQPLRTKIVDAAIEMADKLVAAQYQFQRNLIRSAERALDSKDDTNKTA